MPGAWLTISELARRSAVTYPRQRVGRYRAVKLQQLLDALDGLAA